MESRRKTWLSKEVNVTWVVGLVIAGIGLWSQREKDFTAMQSQLAQTPFLIEQRNRAEDKAQACLQRQIDLIMQGCGRK